MTGKVKVLGCLGGEREEINSRLAERKREKMRDTVQERVEKKDEEGESKVLT